MIHKEKAFAIYNGIIPMSKTRPHNTSPSKPPTSPPPIPFPFHSPTTQIPLTTPSPPNQLNHPKPTMGCVPSKPSNSFYSTNIRSSPCKPASSYATQLQRNRDERARQGKTGLDTFMEWHNKETSLRYGDAYDQLNSGSPSSWAKQS